MNTDSLFEPIQIGGVTLKTRIATSPMNVGYTGPYESVKAIAFAYQMPEELQWQYGYAPLSDEDKRKIFGGNLASLLGIDVSVRRMRQPPAVTAPPVIVQPAVGPAVSARTYEVVVSTPMGELPGKAVLHIDGTALSGTLSLLHHDHAFSGGSIEDGQVTFKGELQTPLGRMPYTVTGTLTDGKIAAVAKTKMGDLAIRSR